MTLNHVSKAEMPEEVAPIRDQVEETVLDLEGVVMGLLSPVAGALLYQYGFRPLRRRREQKKA
ncbi:hypothetical protein LCGC14_0722060 [marine sediment metagenome]|uniref:Uncharacterized protein n=1 Tax=marine sediment metagenome TaxID=412755 RepID=A0A0F9QC36_9ZZZZ